MTTKEVKSEGNSRLVPGKNRRQQPDEFKKGRSDRERESVEGAIHDTRVTTRQREKEGDPGKETNEGKEKREV